MNKEIQSLVGELENVNNGSPWFGRAVFKLMEEVNPTLVYIKPNNSEHSLIDLLYHMLCWAEFTLARIEKDPTRGLDYFEEKDWREINPARHSWEKGMAEFRKVNGSIAAALSKKPDEFLDETVEFRNYNFRFLVQGLIQHNIYHAGQVAYLRKLLG